MPKLQEKPSALKREHPVLKILDYFCGSFLSSWILIRIRNLNADPDPDPATQINADPDPDTYPDAKPCLFHSSTTLIEK
jgi:hypothetical protein